MKQKRITLIAGHYGSGKTNIAINLAFQLRKTIEKVAIADLDIVNPYFRTKDSEEELRRRGIRLICSPFANSNLDLPALPQEMYAITDDRTITAVLDIGGDDRGAMALGRIAPAILAEQDFEMLFVANASRPLTRDAEAAIEVLREIEQAGGIPFTGIINNTNLGRETTPETILHSAPYAQEISQKTSLPIRLTTAEVSLIPALRGKIPNLFPLTLQSKIE